MKQLTSRPARAPLAMLASLALLALLAALALVAGCRRSEVAAEKRNRGDRATDLALPMSVGQLLRATVEARTLPAGLSDNSAGRERWRDMGRFYGRRLYQPAWSDARGPLPLAEELLRAIDAVAAEGIDPGRYRRPDLARLIADERAALRRGSPADPAVAGRMVDLDAQFTYTYLTVAEEITSGRLRPQFDWYTKPRRIAPEVVLQRALATGTGIAPSLAALAPPSPEYARLRQALAGFRALAARGGWPRVPPGADLKPGDRGPRVAALRARLAASGHLPSAPSAGATAGAAAPATPGAAPGSTAAGAAVYDQDVAAAVARFRERHGLEAGKTVDAETLAALNVPLSERIRQIEVNMERWRWLPGDLGPSYILVNVPDFSLQVVEGERVALAMRVVVGKEQSKTPIFSGKLTYVVLNPSWNLPDSIVAKEIAPKLASEPGYLRRKGLQVVKGWGEDEAPIDPASLDASQLGRPGSHYRLRQPPGGDNPLGRIKFLFPNQFDVYLHDTPSGHLFARSERDFSHGCIRLEKPMELAEYLLHGGAKWDPQAFDEKLASGRTTTITVPHPILVHILYWTAWVDRDGTVQFRNDVYGLDSALAEALAREPPVWFGLAPARGDLRAAR
ncbi:MAG TPA: L,D-transpeptidase family protein [Thermoanaerobaculia bacterium]|nr:L,D-transpeptidase family protein [Thermoanaerobaculia bacterium]